MSYRKLLLNLSMLLALGVSFLATPVFATGQDETENIPDQGQESEEDSPADSANGPAIGGGVNNDTEQPSTPTEPTQPAEPSITQPVPQPGISDSDTKPAESTTPSTTAPTQTPSSAVTAVKKPQTQPVQKVPSVSQTTDTEEVNDPEEVENAPVLPTVPNDNIAPDTTIEAPHTGIIESQSSTPNPLAIALLIVSGITIAAAGIVTAFLEKAAKHYQATFQLTKIFTFFPFCDIIKTSSKEIGLLAQLARARL